MCLRQDKPVQDARSGIQHPYFSSWIGGSLCLLQDKLVQNARFGIQYYLTVSVVVRRGFVPEGWFWVLQYGKNSAARLCLFGLSKCEELMIWSNFFFLVCQRLSSRVGNRSCHRNRQELSLSG